MAVGVLPGTVMSAAHTHAATPAQAGLVQGLINQGTQVGQWVSPFVVSAVVGNALAWDRLQGLFWISGALVIASGLRIRQIEQRLQTPPNGASP